MFLCDAGRNLKVEIAPSTFLDVFRAATGIQEAIANFKLAGYASRAFAGRVRQEAAPLSGGNSQETGGHFILTTLCDNLGIGGPLLIDE